MISRGRNGPGASKRQAAADATEAEGLIQEIAHVYILASIGLLGTMLAQYELITPG